MYSGKIVEITSDIVFKIVVWSFEMKEKSWHDLAPSSMLPKDKPTRCAECG
jgi:hypothetical protein